MNIWKADDGVLGLMRQVKAKHHHPRLEQASIAVLFNDAKPFVKERFNWGKTSKFGKVAKLFQGDQYDFYITLGMDAWTDVLSQEQREAWLDLHLTRCQVDFEPETVEVNGKPKPLKDEFGRIQYTDVMKVDEDGNPKWKVVPFDLHVLTDNVLRYGPWCQDLLDFKNALENKDKREAFHKAFPSRVSEVKIEEQSNELAA